MRDEFPNMKSERSTVNNDSSPNRPRTTGRVMRPLAERRARPVRVLRGSLYVQVHFQSVPGARRAHLDAVQPMITQHLHGMVHRGQLILSGGYPASLGGMWLLKVRSREEAERLVREHPAVAANLLTYRLQELQNPLGALLQGDLNGRARPDEPHPLSFKDTPDQPEP
jgi:hypothetical protein